ncbi:MAG: Hsp20/alpha crystallin family protein [Bacteroidota bacterium]
MNLIRWNYKPGLPDIFDNMFRHDFANEMKDCGCAPAVNISEDENKFELHVSAPGLAKEDFKINLENDTLTISSEKKEEKEESGKNYTRKEFYHGAFSRSFSIPQTINRESISAEYENGILRVQLPKKEEAKATLSKEIRIS